MLKWTSKSSMMNSRYSRPGINSPRGAIHEQSPHFHDDVVDHPGEWYDGPSNQSEHSSFNEFNSILVTQPGMHPRTTRIGSINSMDTDLNWSPLSGKQHGEKRKQIISTNTSRSLPSSPEGHKKKQKNDNAPSKGGIFTRFKKMFSKPAQRDRRSKSLPGSPKPLRGSHQKRHQAMVKSNTNERSQTRLERLIESKRSQRHSFRQGTQPQLYKEHQLSPVIREGSYVTYFSEFDTPDNNLDPMTMDSSERSVDRLFESSESTPEKYESSKPFLSRWISKKHRNDKYLGSDTTLHPLEGKNQIKRMRSPRSNDEEILPYAIGEVYNKRYSDTFVEVGKKDIFSRSKRACSVRYNPSKHESDDDSETYVDTFKTNRATGFNPQGVDCIKKHVYNQRAGKAPFIDPKTIQKTKQSLRPCTTERGQSIPDYNSSTFTHESDTQELPPVRAKNNNNGRHHNNKQKIDDFGTSPSRHHDKDSPLNKPHSYHCDKDSPLNKPHSYHRDKTQPKTAHHPKSVKEIVQSLEERNPPNQILRSPEHPEYGEKRHTSKLQTYLVSESQIVSDDFKNGYKYLERQRLHSNEDYLREPEMSGIGRHAMVNENTESVDKQRKENNDGIVSFSSGLSKQTKSGTTVTFNSNYQSPFQMDIFPTMTKSVSSYRETTTLGNIDSREELQSLSSLSRMALEAKDYCGISSMSAFIHDGLVCTESSDSIGAEKSDTDCFISHANASSPPPDDTYAGSIMSDIDSLVSDVYLEHDPYELMENRKEESILELGLPSDLVGQNAINVKNNMICTSNLMFGQGKNGTDRINEKVVHRGGDENVKYISVTERSNVEWENDASDDSCKDDAKQRITTEQSTVGILEHIKTTDSECRVGSKCENIPLACNYPSAENTKESDYKLDLDHAPTTKNPAMSGVIRNDREVHKDETITRCDISSPVMQCALPNPCMPNITIDDVSVDLDKMSTLTQGAKEIYSDRNVMDGQQVNEEVPGNKTFCRVQENGGRLAFLMPEIIQKDFISQEHNDQNWDSLKNMSSIQKRVCFNLQTTPSSLLTTSKDSDDDAIVENIISDQSDLCMETNVTGIEEAFCASNDSLEGFSIATNSKSERCRSVSSISIDVSWCRDLATTHDGDTNIDQLAPSFNTDTQVLSEDASLQSCAGQNIKVNDSENGMNKSDGEDSLQFRQITEPGVSPQLTKQPENKSIAVAPFAKCETTEFKESKEMPHCSKWISTNEPDMSSVARTLSNNREIACVEKQTSDMSTITYVLPDNQEISSDERQKSDITVSRKGNAFTTNKDKFCDADIAKCPLSIKEKENKMTKCGSPIRKESHRITVSSEYNDSFLSSVREDVKYKETYMDGTKQVPYEEFFASVKTNRKSVDNKLHNSKEDVSETFAQKVPKIYDPPITKPVFSKTKEKLHRSLRLSGVNKNDASLLLSNLSVDSCGDYNESDEEIHDSVSDMIVKSMVESKPGPEEKERNERQWLQTIEKKSENNVLPHSRKKPIVYNIRKRVKHKSNQKKPQELDSRRDSNKNVIKARSHSSIIKQRVRHSPRMSDVYYDRYIHNGKVLQEKTKVKAHKDRFAMSPARQTEQVNNENRDTLRDVLNYRPGQWLFVATFLFLQLLIHSLYIK